MSYKLLKVELTSEVVKRSDKAYLFVFAWVAFILSWTLLSSDEHGVFRGFNMQSAIDGIDRAVTEFLERINQRLDRPKILKTPSPLARLSQSSWSASMSA
eukprot:gene23355-30609_t